MSPFKDVGDSLSDAADFFNQSDETSDLKLENREVKATRILNVYETREDRICICSEVLIHGDVEGAWKREAWFDVMRKLNFDWSGRCPRKSSFGLVKHVSRNQARLADGLFTSGMGGCILTDNQ